MSSHRPAHFDWKPPANPSLRWFVFAALACAVGTGLAAGIVPARRAAALDPVAALSR